MDKNFRISSKTTIHLSARHGGRFQEQVNDTGLPIACTDFGLWSCAIIAQTNDRWRLNLSCIVVILSDGGSWCSIGGRKCQYDFTRREEEAPPDP
jgi:hypothetical protein